MKKQKTLYPWQAIYNFYSKAFDFSGTAQRSEILWTLPIIVMISLDLRFFNENLVFWFGMINFIPGIAQIVRRLHDIGLSGWWYLWGILGLPVVCFAVLLISGIFTWFDPLVAYYITGPLSAYIGMAIFICLLLYVFFTPSKIQNNKYRI